jgi:hypothetical protein
MPTNLSSFVRTVLLAMVFTFGSLPGHSMQNPAAAQNRILAMQSALLMVGIVGTSINGLSNTATTLVKEMYNLYLWMKPATIEGIKSELRIGHVANWTHLPKRETLIFNRSSQRQVEAVFQKITENAVYGLPQEGVLITGPAGTGKTSLAVSLVHEGFDVYIVSADEICMRERLFKLQTFARLLAEAPKSRVAIIVEEAEVFFQCLSPAYTNLGSQARREMEAKFLAEFGTHGRAVFLWTANSVKELLSAMPTDGQVQVHHKSSGLLRRFRNVIQTSLPDEPTRRRVVHEALLQRVKVTAPLQLSSDLIKGFNEGFGPRWEVATAGMSPDDLRVIAENIVAREHLRNSSSIETDDLLVAFEDEKASLCTSREASDNEKKAELARLEEEAKIVTLRRKIENGEPATKEKNTN